MQSCQPHQCGSPERLTVCAKQAQVVFRHGARSPFQDSPDAPKIWTSDLRAQAARLASTFQLVDYGSGVHLPLSHALGGSAGAADRSITEAKTLGGGLNCGMLTQAGFEQALELGDKLNKLYVETGFVPSLAQSGDVLLRSSLTARTMETLFGCVCGMWPNEVKSLEQYPVVVGKKGMGSEHTDWINVSIESCPRLMELFKVGVAQWNGQVMPQSVAAFMKTCRETTELQQIDGDALKYGVIAWRDWTSCRLGSGLQLQPGVTMDIFNKLDQFAAQQAASWFMGGLQRKEGDRTETLRLAHGRTLKEIAQRLSDKALGQGPKLVLYSAHDWTVMPLLMMLSDPADDTPWPSFCSHLRIELLRDRNPAGSREHYVRVLYCSGTHGPGMPWGEWQTVSVAGDRGGQLVPLAKFHDIAKHFIPTDYDAECNCSGLPAKTRDF